MQLVFMKKSEEERCLMGWNIPDYGQITVFLQPDKTTVENLLHDVNDKTVQLFSEFVADADIRELLTRSIAMPGLVGIVSEGRDWRGVKGLIRQFHSFVCERRYTKRVNFVLAIGHLAREWFVRCGFTQDKIFEFCYVVEEFNKNSLIIDDYYGPIRLVFVGQLIPRKGVDVLFNALLRIQTKAWTLRILGDGPELRSLNNIALRQGWCDKIQFLGYMNNTIVRGELANADILVLPSHWDGWGAVVNEALMCGTRVICSDYCGSADLIKDTTYGRVFTSGSPDSLADALDQEFKKGPVTCKERLEIMRYADSIRGESIAKYLYEIIEFVSGGYKGLRPIPPWKRQ
jgi:glycosyltransferase involved in cell wall biosynthesis